MDVKTVCLGLAAVALTGCHGGPCVTHETPRCEHGERIAKSAAYVPTPATDDSFATDHARLSVLVQTLAAIEMQMNVHAHNLANFGTTAFKKTRLNFAEGMNQLIRPPGKGVAGLNQDPSGIQVGTGVRVVGTQKIFLQGALEATDNDFDEAIDGDGFFRVILPDSSIAYTRTGSFRIDSEGNLVTGDGYRIEPEITIPEQITRITVDTTGIVYGRDPSNPQQQQQLGQFELTRFVNPSGLEVIGNNLYKESPASGTRVDGTPGLQGIGILRHKFLEASNVNPEEERAQILYLQRYHDRIASLIDALGRPGTARVGDVTTAFFDAYQHREGQVPAAYRVGDVPADPPVGDCPAGAGQK